jgi:lactoylglutathione lyase
MAVKQLRLVLTVEDHEQALAFYRDALGLAQLEDWSTQDGKSCCSTPDAQHSS